MRPRERSLKSLRPPSLFIFWGHHPPGLALFWVEYLQPTRYRVSLENLFKSLKLKIKFLFNKKIRFFFYKFQNIAHFKANFFLPFEERRGGREVCMSLSRTGPKSFINTNIFCCNNPIEAIYTGLYLFIYLKTLYSAPKYFDYLILIIFIL